MKYSPKAFPGITACALIFAAAFSAAAPMNSKAAIAEASLSETDDGSFGGWAVLEGSSLRLSLAGWSDAAGWTLAWDSPADFRLGASATFSGSFEDAVGGLLNAIHPTAPEIAATLYRGNKVLHVSTSVSASAR